LTQIVQNESENRAASDGSEYLPEIPSERDARFLNSTATPPAKVRPLRVLHVIDSLGLGGTEQGVLKIMAGLSPDLFEQRICAIRNCDARLAESAGVTGKVFVSGQNKVGFQFHVPGLLKVLRAYRPHIIHSRNWGAIEAIPAAWLARVPVILHSEHGYEIDMLSGLPWRRRLLRQTLYSLCDSVFTVSRELREYHRQQSRSSARRIDVIPNGVDTRRFAPDADKRQAIRAELFGSSQPIVVGTIGRLVPIKDQRTLLEAAKNLIERGHNLQILLVGGGPELDNLRAFAESSTSLANRVRFLGPSFEVADLFRSLDVFVLPSISEGMSNTLLEAAASEVACIATNIGGNPEIIEDGISGLLFPPKDTLALTQCLEQVVLRPDLRAQLVSAGRQRAVTCFSIDRMMERYTTLYLDLARKSGLYAKD
jgi:sugar transferase (PEP-CTERM/EpsH1 system associated)